MKINQLVEFENSEFYPTPESTAEKMLEGIQWEHIETVLEPSAGKGDLVLYLGKKYAKERALYDRKQIQVDCIEIEPNLRGIIEYKFGGKYHREVDHRIKQLTEGKKYSWVTNTYDEFNEEQQKEVDALKLEKDALSKLDVKVIFDDFLKFVTNKKYDLIVMNPPFSNGDIHLLKALEMQKNGGQIICLLNAETLLNPYSNSRKVLQQQLEKYGAKIQYFDHEFSNSERKTDVQIAMVKVSIPVEYGESIIYTKLKKAHEQEEIYNEVTDLAVDDFIQQIVNQFNLETDAGVELIREYNAIRPYMLYAFNKDDWRSRESLLTLTVGDKKECSVNRYLKLARNKYWTTLFENPKFTGKLTSNLRKKYMDMVGEMSDYDFNLYNIKRIMAEMNSEMLMGVKESIMNLFEKLSAEHSYYPECSKNIHYYNGWKSNSVHKINNKVIIPTWGMFSSYSWSDRTFEVSTAYSVLSDIEKVLNYLDGNMSAEFDLLNSLEYADKQGQTRKIPCKYFEVTLYKKGTTHIKFTNQRVLDAFNIYVARNKNWLPPSYGKKTYSNMDEEERRVIDEFQGEKEYNKVMENPQLYMPSKIIEPLALGA